VHPIAIASIAVLLINDHVLKAVAPGAVTGKLSDLAGLVFFPLLLASVVELAAGRTHRRPVLAWSIAATALMFVVVKTTAGGADAFAFALGATQWIVTLGPLRDAVLAPVAVVADRSDLLAMPALAVAWWVGTAGGSPRRLPTDTPRRQRAMASAALIVAGLASMATSQSTPMVSSEIESEFHLTTEQPVAVRHFTITIVADDSEIDQVRIGASVERRRQSDEVPELADDPAIDLTMLPDERRGVIDTSGEALAGRSLNVTGRCQAGCTQGVTLIARLRPASGLAELDGVMAVGVYVNAGYDEPTVDTEVTVAEDLDRRVDGAAPTMAATIDGTITVATNDPIASRRIELAVPAAALADPLAFPLVGRLTVRVEPEAASDDRYAWNSTVSIEGGETEFIQSDGPPIDSDWLAKCQAGTDCVVTIDLAAEYQAWLNAPVGDADLDADAPEPTETRPGFVRLHWTIEAVLQAFDGRRLPTDGMTLTAD
jgi:hypothetical protein